MKNEDIVSEFDEIAPGQTITFHKYLYEMRYDWERVSTIKVLDDSTSSDQYSTLIGEMDITFTIPKDYDRTRVQLFALRQLKEEKVKQFTEVLKDLDETMAKLESIAYDPGESAAAGQPAASGPTEDVAYNHDYDNE